MFDRTGFIKLIGPTALVGAALLLAACGGDDEPVDDGTRGPGPADGVAPAILVEPAETTPGGKVRAIVVNGGDEPFTYGAGYELYREDGDESVRVDDPNRAVIQIAYVADPGEAGPPVRVKIPRDAEPGTYRILLQRDVPDLGDLEASFEVVEDG